MEKNFKFKLYDVKKAIEGLLKKWGKDYVYPYADTDGYSNCQYEDDSDAGGCIVGCVARVLLPNPGFEEMDTPNNQPWAGEFSPKAIRFLTKVQGLQDKAVPWGQAYDGALEDEIQA